MKRNQYILLGAALITLPTLAQAQAQYKDTTVNRTVVVEQEYTPLILDAAKINVLPTVEELTISKKKVEYATTFSPATTIPGSTMEVYAIKEVKEQPLPGYARLGYGSYGNLDVKANYLFRLSPKDKLNLNLAIDGMDGKLDMPFQKDVKWNAYYYRTRANADYTHQFNGVDFNVAANFGLSNFNYEPHSFDKQKFTSGDLHFGVNSTDETLPMQFCAETNLMMYGRQQNQYDGSMKETIVRTKGSATGSISDEQQISVAVEMNNIFYNSKIIDLKDEPLFDTRTSIDLNPYYELSNDNWKIRLGANVDFSLGGGTALRVSPDATVQYLFSESYILYANATGGRQVNDFRQLEVIHPYANLSSSIKDTYEQLNASLGFKASPTPGLWLNAYGGYQALKDDLYPLQNGYIGGSVSYLVDMENSNTNNVYFGGKASYQYKDLFSLSAQSTYYHWSSNQKELNNVLMMKPQLEANFQAEVHPLSPLALTIGYQYTKRTNEYAKEVIGSNIAPISNLSIGASYKLFNGVSMYARVNNLFNKQYQHYFAYPTEGINFLGGLSFQF